MLCGLRRSKRLQRGIEPRGERLGLGTAPEDAAEQPIKRRIVERPERVGDDEVRHALREAFGGLTGVLVDVDDHMGGIEAAHPVDIDILRAADLRDRTQRLARMDAETSPTDELGGKAQIAQQLGDARYQADDARLGRRGVRRPGGVDPWRHRLLPTRTRRGW